MNFVISLHTAVRVFTTVNSHHTFAFFAYNISGVLTGCPLSASLFVIAMNTFLLRFKEIIVDKSYGVLYACADDLGSSLLRISSLLQMRHVLISWPQLLAFTLTLRNVLLFL